MNRKNLHLGISSVAITAASLAYGVAPNCVLSKLFDFSVDSIDLHQVFRATMGGYLGVVVFWLVAIFKPTYWRVATLSNVLFMVGLATGRIVSLVADGIPSIFFSIGLAIELLIAFWGIWNLKKYKAI